jgi:Lipopolysaccharide biosynthesis proteins, LPS:glycosyltransferases
MREEKISEKIFKYIEQNNETLFFSDQDAINAVLRDKRKAIPLKFNALHRVFL